MIQEVKCLSTVKVDIFCLYLLQVLRGEITVSRRPTTAEDTKPENCLPCTGCKAWVFERNLSLHSKRCPCAQDFKDTNYKRNSRMLLCPFISFESKPEKCIVAMTCSYENSAKVFSTNRLQSYQYCWKISI